MTEFLKYNYWCLFLLLLLGIYDILNFVVIQAMNINVLNAIDSMQLKTTSNLIF